MIFIYKKSVIVLKIKMKKTLEVVNHLHSNLKELELLDKELTLSELKIILSDIYNIVNKIEIKKRIRKNKNELNN
jgi:hypothetical protein